MILSSLIPVTEDMWGSDAQKLMVFMMQQLQVMEVI